jgi:hypothetical protein
MAIPNAIPLTFTITDSGPPLNPEEREKVLTELPAGHEYDLTLAGKIMEKYDGQIAVEAGSTGTAISVSLPAVSESK